MKRRTRAGSIHCCMVLLQVLSFVVFGFSQQKDLNGIRNLIKSFKKDERGPYQAIRWFCPDGTIIPPDQRCEQPGGTQHAIHKNVVVSIAKESGIYLGQILAGVPFENFLDAAHQNSRMKQYQMEKYLQVVDDGWIVRRARYYRGAVQAEDEEAWGINFLTWLLANNQIVTSQYFLMRQAIKDIPHQAANERVTNIRVLSKTIADSLPAFMDLRVKIHGQPDAEDLQRVKDFRTRNQQEIPPNIDEMLKTLEKDLELAYQSFNLQSLIGYVAKLPADSPIAELTKRFIRSYGSTASMPKHSQNLLVNKCREIAELLWSIRKNILSIPSAASRLAVIDLSIELENILFRDIGLWQPEMNREVLEKSYALAQAAAACGYLEVWEWEAIDPILHTSLIETRLSFEQFLEKVNYTRRAVEWSTGMVRAVYDPVITLFSGFEPLAKGFFDEQVRSTILLPFGEVAWQLVETGERLSGLSNTVMGIGNPNQIRGLNPGFALGELEVVTGTPEDVSFSAKKIYVLLRAPADLKPVAGIATVSEGNLVSHVQLLARNLGIPNAGISQQNLKDLVPFSGQVVFYAVSPRGTIIMKPASEMTLEEKSLVEVRKRREDRMTVPTDKIDLSQNELLSLRNLRTSDSGRICGPKAANLGQLKRLFPIKVVDGLVIPFGIFRRHFDQPMPGSNSTYWQFLQATFAHAANERCNGKIEEEIENDILKRLAQLREAIRTMPFSPGFKESLRLGFLDVFGVEIGQLPVFIRSDTNMEDLKDFTGAGLNLTVFNVVEEAKILQSIREVWASPYTERSYRWRQKYLLNPENVYPSILILPTVDVDKSGVMITTGVLTLEPRDITVAFNRGAGGAVEGQLAESYLLRNDGRDVFLSPSRETQYIVLPKTGGTRKGYTNFNQPILSSAELKRLREVAEEVRRKLPGAPGIVTSGPFDVELGFKDDAVWLFQVRPFVENKKALSSLYLQSLDPKLPQNVEVILTEKVETPH